METTKKVVNMNQVDLKKRVVGPYLHPDHKRPVTRRQFLSRGFLGGAALITMPSLFSMFAASKQARAACAALGGGVPQIPFIGFDLAGGANIAGSNVLVGASGQLDELSIEGYRKLGLPEELTPQRLGTDVFNDELGLLFHRDSALLAGIMARTSADTRSRINGTVLCCRSNDDTNQNPHNPIYGVRRAGANGELVQLIGTSSTDSGGRSMAPAAMLDPEYRPTKVDRPSDATGLVDTGELANMLGAGNAGDVMASMAAISGAKVGLTGESAETQEFINCVYSQSEDLVRNFSDKDALDPTKDLHMVPLVDPAPDPPTTIFASVDELEDDRTYRKAASVAKLVVGGTAGAGTVELGGYDYHDSTRSTGERRDFEAGEAIGIALEYASRVGRDLMIYCFTDGGVSSNGQMDNAVGKPVWKGDSGGTAAAFILAYGAAGRPNLTDPARAQIGVFKSSGSVETSHSGRSAAISNSPALLAETVVLNYLALHGRVGDYGTVMNGSPGITGALDELIAFDVMPS